MYGSIELQVERVQTAALYNLYMTSKENMEKANPVGTQNERHLWHGTTVTMTHMGPMPVTSINSNGFNRSFCGTSTGEIVIVWYTSVGAD